MVTHSGGPRNRPREELSGTMIVQEVPVWFLKPMTVIGGLLMSIIFMFVFVLLAISVLEWLV